MLSGTIINFSQPQTVGTKSDPQQVTLTNNGDVSLSDISIAVAGDFTAQNSCGSFLVGHASCAISITFVPTMVGLESGTVTVTTQLGSQKIALSGTGIAPPGISALPATVNFGGQAVNAASTPQRVILTNTGGSALNALTFSITGDYAIAGTSCSSGQTLNAGSNCYIDVIFTPSQAGQRNGSLTVSAADLSAPLNVALTGSGEDFQILVTGSSSAVIVTGQTANFVVQVISVNGSDGTLTMGCTGVPQSATCTVNPLSLPVTSAKTGHATVTIATGVTTTSSSSNIPADPWRRIGIALGAMLPCILLGVKRGSKQIRGWYAFFLASLLGIALVVPIACGTHATGGGSPTTPDQPQGPTTPSGTYTLNITASIPGLQRSVPVTVTIQ